MRKNSVSEHTFLFPFTWKYNGKKNHTLFLQHIQLRNKDFEKLSEWKIHYVSIEEDKDYNEFVYFYKPIRAALYTFYKAPVIVRNYEYKALDQDNYFIISVSGREYVLTIESLQLKLYKTGIGILSFRVSNTRYEDIEAIEAINSFSKSIYPPILPLEKAKEELFPDFIRIKLNAHQKIEEEFKANYHQERLSISPLIMSILGKPFICKESFFKPGSIFIEPILGNQMFCLCLYKNATIVKEIQTGLTSYDLFERIMTVNKKVSYHEKDDIPGHIGSTYYLKNEGNIYGMSRFALLCVAKELPKSKLYDQLVSLVLMQRATLLSLSTEIARVSTLPKYDLVQAIASIYEIYIQFINQLYFKEVTEDAQGAHIYEKLSKQLKIEEEMTQLNFEIDEVREYASLIEQAQSKVKVQILTIIGAALVLPTFATGFFGMNIFKEEIAHWWQNRQVSLWMNTYVFLPILVTLAFCTWNRGRTKLHLFIKVFFVLFLLISIFIIYKYGSGL